MSRFLLDTYVLIWFQQRSDRLSQKAIEVLENANNTILFSQISIFELSIKQKTGKLSFENATIESIYDDAINEGFTYMNIHNDHIYKYHSVPLFEQHRDPFDRLLIATAIKEKAIIISDDSKFSLYSNLVEILW